MMSRNFHLVTPPPEKHSTLKDIIREFLKKNWSLAELDLWFEPLKLEFDVGRMQLTVFFPHIHFEAWFDRHGKPAFEECACKAGLQLHGKEVKISYNSPNILNQKAFFIRRENNFSPEDPGYRLDSFLVNAKNEFPLAAAKAVCDPEEKHSYNPFVVYGKNGTGKTHLLRAMATAFTHTHGQTRVFNGSADAFADALAREDAHAFLLGYTAIVADDVQRLAHNPPIQEKLVMIIDECLDRRRQMVFAFSRPPSSLEGFTESLRSRLAVGLMVELKEPDIDVRMRFAQSRCRQYRIKLDKAHLLLLAQRCLHIRHLNGIILKLAALHSLAQRDVTVADLENILCSSGEDKPLTSENIIAIVAEHTGVSVKDILGGKRRPACVQARQTAMFLCRELLGASYPALGKIFGGKDHSTVMHSTKKIRKMMDSNKETHQTVTELRKKCLAR